ncbi:Methanogenesis regulatory histidine kinase FilI [uncultured archaeon]|nr:Methanogenesis regulatory histidine kinase FilI [uncultured archaeon]
MNTSVFFDIISTIGFGIALIFCLQVRKNVIDKATRMFLFASMGIYFFTGIGKLLQWFSITDYFIPYLGFFEVLFVPFFLFFVYSFDINHELKKRKKVEEALQRSNNDLEIRINERTAELATSNESLKLEIAERTHAEKILRESEEQIRNLLDSTAEAIYGIDLNGNCTFCNPACLRMLGYSGLDDLIGKNMHNLTHHSRNDQAIVGGEGFHAEDELLWRADGTCFPAEYWSYPVRRNNEVVGAVMTFFDITKRRQAEERLLQSEEKYRMLIENNQDGIFISQYDKIQFANKAFARIHGYTVEEIIGKDIREIITPEDIDKAVDIFRGIQAGNDAPREFELRALHRDRKTRIFVNMNVGRITYCGMWANMGTVKDITERKKVEEMQLENQRLVYLNKAKSEFLANMSHELRTPLNSIIGFTELLKQKAAGELNEKQDRYVENVLTNSKFLLNLIADILDFNKIEEGRMDLVIETLSVPETINKALELLKENASRKYVTLKAELDPELNVIEADRQRFDQILSNLVGNAIKFSRTEGGTVTITTKKEGNMGIFQISDTGIGIKEHDIERLFKAFEQLESGISRKYGGTGLGLAITKRLVELHGGEITAVSKYGQGSTFTFSIPISRGWN